MSGIGFALCVAMNTKPVASQTFIRSRHAGSAHRHAILATFLLFLLAELAAAEDVWQAVGPAGGSISQIIPDRGHPGVWYLLESSAAGLYRSTDNGETWKFTKIRNVHNILVHPASSEVFVTVPGNNWNYYALLSSTDLGHTFEMRSPDAPFRIFGHPSNPKVLWGSGVSNLYDLSVSYDGGENWQQFHNLPFRLDKEYDLGGYSGYPTYYELQSVLVSPLDPETVYISTAAVFDQGCGGESISLHLTSKNSGRSWSGTEDYGSHIYDPAFPDRAFFISYDETRILRESGWQRLNRLSFNDLISVPGKPNLLYGIRNGKQWMSRDGGVNWSYVTLGPGGKSLVLKARSTPEGSLIAGTVAGIYIVDDNQRWHQAKKDIREPSTIRDVATAPRSSTVYAVVGNYFLFRSQNSGKTWRNITDNLPLSPNFIYLQVNPGNQKHVFATVNNRMLVSLDAGETWTYVPEKAIRVFFSQDSTLYFSRNRYSHLFKSLDGGITLQELKAEYGSKRTSILDLAVDRFNGTFYVATEHGLYRSNDQGTTAHQIAIDLLPDCPRCLGFSQIVPLTTRGQYLAATEIGLVKTINEGITWQKLSQTTGRIYPVDDFGRHVFMLSGRLLESRDGGRNFEDITRSIDPNLGRYSYVQAITDPGFRPVYAVTDLGMYRLD